MARKIATLRYDKRGSGGWKPEFGRPEDFRFKDYVDDAVALVNYLRGSGKFSKLVLIGHSEGGLVAILAARRVPIDRLVLLVTAARRQGDLIKAQLEKKLAPDVLAPIDKAIDAIMAGQSLWSGRRDSNPRPRPWQGRALPLSYTRIREAGGDGCAGNGQSYAKCGP